MLGVPAVSNLGNSMQRRTEAYKPEVDTLLFAYRTFTPLAEGTALFQTLNTVAILTMPSASFMRPGSLAWKKFTDGYPDIMINDVNLLRGRHCVVLIDLLDKSSMFEQLARV